MRAPGDRHPVERDDATRGRSLHYQARRHQISEDMDSIRADTAGSRHGHGLEERTLAGDRYLLRLEDELAGARDGEGFSRLSIDRHRDRRDVLAGQAHGAAHVDGVRSDERTVCWLLDHHLWQDDALDIDDALPHVAGEIHHADDEPIETRGHVDLGLEEPGLGSRCRCPGHRQSRQVLGEAQPT